MTDQGPLTVEGLTRIPCPAEELRGDLPSPAALRDQANQEEYFFQGFPWRWLAWLLGWGLLGWLVLAGAARLKAWHNQRRPG